MSDRGEYPRQTPAAEDPSQYNQRRQLQELGDLRVDTDASILDVVDNQTAKGPEWAFAHARALVQRLEWTMREHGGEKYTHEKLGEVVVEPPEKLQRLVGPGHADVKLRNSDGVLRQVERVIGAKSVEPRMVEVQGLIPSGQPGTSFVEMDMQTPASWTIQLKLRHEDAKPRTFSDTAPVPLDVTNAALRKTYEFLNDVDLDISVDEGRPHNNYSE